MKKNNELVSIDNTALSFLKLNKAELEKSALNLKSNLDALTEYEALYKLQYLVKYRMECVKDLALEKFTEKFEGSQTEKDNGFTVTLKTTSDIVYSDKVRDLEAEVKMLENQLKQLKQKEIKTAERINTKEILSLRLH
jgi:hypothetical protein